MSKYYLKHKNEDLISFDMDNKFGLEISNIQILSNNKDIFPIYLLKEINEVNIIKFINSRIIPKNRAFVENILNSAGLSINDKKGIIDISKGLSLIDPYWIVQDNTLKFEDFNLYDNDFSEILSLIAFTGYNSKIKGLISSPEFSTNGMLPKAWRRIDNKVILYKGSTENFHAANTGYEPYSEYYASLVAEKLGYNHVSYDLDKWKNMIVSTCPLFTSKDISFVQIADVVPTGSIKAIYEYIDNLGFAEDLSNLLLFDAVIGNLDRHYGNFGLLRDNNTGKFISLAPIFDNGESLLSKELPNVFNDINEYNKLLISAKYEYSYYDIQNDLLIRKYCTKKHIKDLRKLLNFELTLHSKYNLSDERIKTINRFIQDRAKHYIDILENK